MGGVDDHDGADIERASSKGQTGPPGDLVNTHDGEVAVSAADRAPLSP